MLRSRLLLLPALALVVALPACDLYEPDLDDFAVILNIDDVPVDLGPGVSATIRPDRPTATTTDVQTDLEVEAIEELEEITLRPDMFSFTAGVFARSASGGAAASGTITAHLAIDGVPVPGLPVVITITDGAVTSVAPETIDIGEATIDAASVRAFIDSLPASERPPLADWESLSPEEVREAISDGLGDGAFSVTVGYVAQSADGSAPLTGTLTLDEIDISAIVRR